jgi:hypothetical protein
VSSTERSERAPSRDVLESPPQFALECTFDDPSNPTEVTVYSPGSENVTTEWLTVDRSTAVPLERVA